MDGDLQHDERLLPRMLETLKDESVDVVIGSRYVADGDIGKGLNIRQRRVADSRPFWLV
jgi:dolichol-phosphate mannosyltransferase